MLPGSAVIPLPSALFAKPQLLPNSRYDGRALRTFSVVRDFHLLDQIAITLDEQFIAGRAIGILPATDSARKVTRIDVTQTRFTPHLARTKQLCRRRVRILSHVIVLMKRRHMPGYVRC